MNLSPEMKRNLIVALIGAILFAPIGWFFYDSWKNSWPVEPYFAPNRQAKAIDIEIRNPSSTTYRALQATFSVKERMPPPIPVGAPVAVHQIVFTKDDYHPLRDAYSKSISQIKLPANDETTFRIYIIDPNHKNWTYRGKLVIEYGDRENPKTIVNQNHYVLVTDRIPKAK